MQERKSNVGKRSTDHPLLAAAIHNKSPGASNGRAWADTKDSYSTPGLIELYNADENMMIL